LGLERSNATASIREFVPCILNEGYNPKIVDLVGQLPGGPTRRAIWSPESDWLGKLGRRMQSP
jgi:hypothetical protein